jgi:hypothetical protein
MTMTPETKKTEQTTKGKGDVYDGLAALRTLRDEIRVQIHLGGMEARQKWDVLEREFQHVQAAAKHVTEASLQALTGAFLELKASLKATAGRR